MKNRFFLSKIFLDFKIRTRLIISIVFQAADQWTRGGIRICVNVRCVVFATALFKFGRNFIFFLYNGKIDLHKLNIYLNE